MGQESGGSKEPDGTVTLKDLAATGNYLFLFVDEKLCVECGQGTHQYDRDVHHTKMYLWWSKSSRHVDGKLYPAGAICGWCLDTITKHRKKQMTEKELKVERSSPRRTK